MKLLAAWTLLSIAATIAAAVLLRRDHEAGHDTDDADLLDYLTDLGGAR